ncbi:MAG: response regulator [Alphaproteobacteria bacterium]|nr:MAG: response regulator [Alphaproteobacteria bacterium]
MDIVIVEDEILLGLLLADALTDVGHRVLGPASCRAEALGLVSDRTPHLALVDIELRDGESGIELAAELRRHGVACVFTTGQPVGARAHRELALGLVEKPYNPTTILEVVRYFEALHAGERPAGVPRGLELFGPDALPVSLGLLDTSAPAVVPCAGSGAPGAAPSAAAISASLPAQSEQRLGDAGVLEALTG